MFWGVGWSYEPPPSPIFPPQSGPLLGLYVPKDAGEIIDSPDALLLPTDNAFGAGPRDSINVWWFNAQSLWVGCNNSATDLSMVSDFVATGWQWDSKLNREIVAITEHFPQPPCPDLHNCRLQQIFLQPAFSQLSSLSLYCVVAGVPQTFWVDTIELSWWNNSCAAGLERISQE